MDLDFLNLIRISEDRMLSMLIRDRNHPDYGFFSKKKLIDEKPVIQCLVHPLSLLVTDKIFNSKLYGEEMPIRWTKAAILNIIELQNSNGSYGNKEFFYWTPIIVYHVTMAYRKMSIYFDDEEKKFFETSLAKAGNYLCKIKLNDYLRIVENIVALYELFKLIGNRKYDEVASELLVKILKLQHNTGFIESKKGFDIRKHFVLVELISKYHFLNKSDVSKSILKAGISILSKFQRPDGTLENEIFECEEFLTPPGYIINMSKEFPETVPIICGMVESSKKMGIKIIPYQDIVPFSLSINRLFTTYKLLQKYTFENISADNGESSNFFKDLSVVMIELKNLKIFINPSNSRIKIFSNCERDKTLIYSDSGYLLKIDEVDFIQKNMNENNSLTLSPNEVKFSSILMERKKSIISFKKNEIPYDRIIEFNDKKIVILTKFFLNNIVGEEFELYRIYRKINRMFRIEDIKIPSREDLEIEHTLVDNCITTRENITFKDNIWINETLESIIL